MPSEVPQLAVEEASSGHPSSPGTSSRQGPAHISADDIFDDMPADGFLDTDQNTACDSEASLRFQTGNECVCNPPGSLNRSWY